MNSTTVECFFYVGGFCETLECNADAFQGLWHSEKEKETEEGGSKRDLRMWPLILSKERSQA